MILSGTPSMIQQMKKKEIPFGQNRIETPAPDDLKKYH